MLTPYTFLVQRRAERLWASGLVGFRRGGLGRWRGVIVAVEEEGPARYGGWELNKPSWSEDWWWGGDGGKCGIVL